MTRSFLGPLFLVTVVHGLMLFMSLSFEETQPVQKRLTQLYLSSQSPAPQMRTKAPSIPVQPRQNISHSVLPVETISQDNPIGVASAVNPDLLASYKAELRDLINKNKYYPALSKRLGQTGVVVVAFTLLEDGNIIDVRIETPSPYERLNSSALEAVKKVVRFRPIPKEIGEGRMDIKVPIKFMTI